MFSKLRYYNFASIIKLISSDLDLGFPEFVLTGKVNKDSLNNVDIFSKDLYLTVLDKWSYGKDMLRDEIYLALYGEFSEEFPFGFDKEYNFEWNTKESRLKVFVDDCVYKFRV